MKNSRKIFILTETVLAFLVILLVFPMFLEKNGKGQYKVSVVIQNSDSNQWSAFKYGLKMAAEDQEIELFVVTTGEMLTAKEEKGLIEYEIENGADAVIVQPVPGDETEKILKSIEKKVPIMLVESAVSKDKEVSLLPVTEPDNYGMGKALAEELLKDYNGNVDGKVFGILTEYAGMESSASREKGFLDVVEHKGAEIGWSVSNVFSEGGENSLESLPEVDLVIALDDNSLCAAGKRSAANDLHGALVYGIGNSTEAIYYLDTDIVRCLVVPDGFQAGYQSLTEMAQSLGHYFHTVQGQTVSHTVLRKDALFLEENQEILFTMSQ